MKPLLHGKSFESFQSYSNFISDFVQGQSDCAEAKDMQKKTEAYIRGYSAQHSLDQINAIKESK